MATRVGEAREGHNNRVSNPTYSVSVNDDGPTEGGDGQQGGSFDKDIERWMNNHSPLLEGHKVFEFTFETKLSGHDSYGSDYGGWDRDLRLPNEIVFRYGIPDLGGIDLTINARDPYGSTLGVWVSAKSVDVTASISGHMRISLGVAVINQWGPINLGSMGVTGVIDIEKQSLGLEANAGILDVSGTAEVGARMGPGIPAWLIRGVTEAVSTTENVKDGFTGVRY